MNRPHAAVGCGVGANSLITIQVDTLEDIKELRKTFAPVVHKQPELHLGELVRDYFPQIFFKHEV